MTGLEKLLAIFVVILVVGAWAVAYKACTVKFPDAPTWACAVKP